MYGLTPDSIERFAYLRGGEVQQVCVGKFDLQFDLHPRARLSVWRRCELVDARGDVVDVWQEGRRSERFCAFVDLLGAVVADVSIDIPNALRIRFVDGRHLLLLDDSKQYESFSVDDVIV